MSDEEFRILSQDIEDRLGDRKARQGQDVYALKDPITGNPSHRQLFSTICTGLSPLCAELRNLPTSSPVI